jgi:dihydroxyacetone kinase-like protein
VIDMTRRQFINARDDVVAEALRGFAIAHEQSIELHGGDGGNGGVGASPVFVARRNLVAGKVGLVSGGGSGHEPLHVGFVGAGMLDAAVPGRVFASPTALQVAAATRHVQTGAGVLQIVKNYTGDVLNFEIAAEIAADDGIEVRSVLVDDDLATRRADGQGPGGRGTAAVLVVEKACGAAAAAGRPLAEVAAIGRRVVEQSRSLAVALAAGAHPGESAPSFDLPADLVELGVGIHGERGVGRRSFAPARELAGELVAAVVADLGLRADDPVIAIVNGLGATHDLELHLVLADVAELLAARGIRLARARAGSFVTSLDMAGLSLTLTRADDDLLELWDAPVRTPAWTW